MLGHHRDEQVADDGLGERRHRLTGTPWREVVEVRESSGDPTRLGQPQHGQGVSDGDDVVGEPTLPPPVPGRCPRHDVGTQAGQGLRLVAEPDGGCMLVYRAVGGLGSHGPQVVESLAGLVRVVRGDAQASYHQDPPVAGPRREAQPGDEGAWVGSPR